MTDINNYKSIKLSKQFYEHSTKTFTQILDELDPYDIYADANSPLKTLDPYERQLRRFDIKVKGDDADNVKKFFETNETALLFPEFVNRKINRGYESNTVLSHVIGYHSYYLNNNYDSFIDCELTKTDIGIYKLKKDLYGEIKPLYINLDVIYESIKDLSLNSFGVILNSMGNALAYDTFNYCIKRIIESFINKDDSIRIKDVTYKRIISIMNLSYGLDTIVCDLDTLSKILALPELVSYIDSNKPGIYKTNIGISIIGCKSLKNEIVVLNSTNAINAVYGSKNKLNWKSLINSDFDKIEYVNKVGFYKLMDRSVIRCLVKE